MRIESSRPDPQAAGTLTARVAASTSSGATDRTPSGLDSLALARAEVTRLIGVAASFEVDLRLESAVRHLHRLEKQAQT